MSIRRIYVEKKVDHIIEAKSLKDDLKVFLGINGIEDLIILNRYDIEGLNDDEFNSVSKIVFAEPMMDMLYEEQYLFLSNDKYFAIEYLPGQFDMRADSAIQCIKVITNAEDIDVRSAKVYVVRGDISDKDILRIKKYLINEVDQREASLDKPTTLKLDTVLDESIQYVEGFINFTDDDLISLLNKLSLAMSIDDLKVAHDYFKNIEKRNPTVTEIKVLDTYWSDHCRHTTFNTILTSVEFIDGRYKKLFSSTYDEYIAIRQDVFGDRLSSKPVTLMDLAIISTRARLKDGTLDNLEESEENNAASIVVDIEYEGGTGDTDTDTILLMFKNETHNHPTEIEPFGGAATCLGGAIRDPLSGRSYVYQAMRISGASDPRERVEKTLVGKLPQIKICRESARGYSSYGNQIGIATGHVKEFYHSGFKAKRMEVGAVIGAVLKNDVTRETPLDGDLIIMLGGRTGRDGVGGATGSSKEQNSKSVDISSAEVQKGNAPEEHKLLRLFRKPKISKMIKKSNDFGAGGVSVSVGEIADGVEINLEVIIKKYEGLTPSELALSESQERMSVVIDRSDLDEFIKECHRENIEAVVIATVTDKNRLTMKYKDNLIVDIGREFLDTAGAVREQEVVAHTDFDVTFFNTEKYNRYDNFYLMVINKITDINLAIQQGLVESFDSTIGARTVLSPYGGRHQLTEAETMISKIPTSNNRDTVTVSVVAYGYNPYLSDESPYHGAYFAVIESVTKMIAAGVKLKDIRLSFQEYFERLGDDKLKWGNPLLSLLGALKALNSLSLASISGKDSMSGTYKDTVNDIELTVPPTLISFAFATTKVDRVVTGEFKKAGEKVYLIKTDIDDDKLIDIERYLYNIELIDESITDEELTSIYTVKDGGIITALVKMSLGNMIGVEISAGITLEELQIPYYGSFIISTSIDSFDYEREVMEIGVTIDEPYIRYQDSELLLTDLAESSIETLSSVYTSSYEDESLVYKPIVGEFSERIKSKNTFKAQPRVAILALPGSNCEYDTKRAFEISGSSDADIFVFRNRSIMDIKESCEEFAKMVDNSQILAIPGGFSAGDEPDGSGKFFTSVFMNPLIKESIHNLIHKRDGLVIGICNGFQALLKSGLLSKGYIGEQEDDDPTLSFNKINRHVSRFVRTRVSSIKSPWLLLREVGEIDKVAVSHGEGRFVAPKEYIDKLFKNGQVAFQYVDGFDNVTMKYPYNPNGSVHAIEGITSVDGRVLGKMGHSERFGENLHINNRYDSMNQMIFASGIKYFL